MAGRRVMSCMDNVVAPWPTVASRRSLIRQPGLTRWHAVGRHWATPTASFGQSRGDGVRQRPQPLAVGVEFGRQRMAPFVGQGSPDVPHCDVVPLTGGPNRCGAHMSSSYMSGYRTSEELCPCSCSASDGSM
jgi:hypothetical protein